MQNNQNHVQIKVKDEEMKGVYSNVMQSSHTKEEFILDFFNMLPPFNTLASRVIISPGHYKRMVMALEDNLKKYESTFGKIEAAKQPEKGIGFRTNK